MKNSVFVLIAALLLSNFILAQSTQFNNPNKLNKGKINYSNDLENWIVSKVNTAEIALKKNINSLIIQNEYYKEPEITLYNDRLATQLSYSEEHIFNYDSTYAPEIVCLDETHFVIVYPDSTQNRQGIVLAGTIYPDSIVFGNKVTFHNSSVHNFVQIEALSPTRFVITYIAGIPIKGFSVIGDVYDNEITLGPTCIFNPNWTSSYLSVSSMSPDQIVISFTENDNSIVNLSAVVGNIVNDSIVFSNEFPIYSGGASSNIVLATDSMNFIDIFSDHDSIKAVIGTVSGATISYSNIFKFNNTDDASYMDASYLGNNKVAIVYTDYTNDYSQNVLIATISSDSITAGQDIVFSPPTSPPSGYHKYQYIDAIDTSNFIISFMDTHNNHRGSCILGTLLGDSIDLSIPYVYNSNTTGWAGRLSKINSTHFILVIINDWNDPYGYVKIGNISIETSIPDMFGCNDSISFPILTRHLDGIIEFELVLSYDPSKLQYINYTNPYPDLSSGDLTVTNTDGEITIYWVSPEPLQIIYDTLINLSFSSVNPLNYSNDSLSFNTPLCFYNDQNSFYVSSMYDHGSYILDPIVDSANIIYGADSVYYGSLDEEYYTSQITNATSYYWSLEPDSAGSVAAYDTIVYIDFSNDFIGEAVISVVGSNNCGDGFPEHKTIYVVDEFVGIQHTEDHEPKVKIWPNPSLGEFTVSTFGINQNFDVLIYNSNLQLIQKERIRVTSDQSKFSLKIDVKSSGIYTIRFCNESTNLTRKVMIIK